LLLVLGPPAEKNLSTDDYLEDTKGNHQNCSML